MPHTPAYSWVCHKCKATNPPGADLCSSCGCAAVISADELEDKHKRGDKKQDKEDSESRKNAKLFAPIILIPFGLYLMYGSYVSISEKKWPWFMPPQFDLIALVFGGWNSAFAAYAAGTITGLVGLLCAIGGFLIARSEA